MIRLLRYGPSSIWLLLSAITLSSWWFGTEHGQVIGSHHVGMSTALIVLACIKVRLVMLHFMEVRNAPWPLRWFCECWLVCLGIAMLILCRYR